ncbi:protein-arginine deiminase family protein [Streptomyces sp. NPDC002845]
MPCTWPPSVRSIGFSRDRDRPSAPTGGPAPLRAPARPPFRQPAREDAQGTEDLYGPEAAVIFTEAVTAAYRQAGLKVSYIDDWYTYHLGQGEVRCGTNTLRDTSTAWWHRP